MIEQASALHAAMVSSYVSYLAERLDLRGWTVDAALSRAIEEGRSWLEAELAAELSLPFEQQRRGPLEIFQAAMRTPTEAMRESGREPVNRDPVARAAIPGDAYDLAPASSSSIGDEVWSAHLAWGAAKAAGLRH